MTADASLTETTFVALVTQDNPLCARLPLIFDVSCYLVFYVLIDVLTESLLVKTVIEPCTLMRLAVPRLLIFLGCVLKWRNPGLHFFVELVPEISDCRVVGLLYIMSVLKLKVGMDWSVILSHLLLEMGLQVLRILFEDLLSVNLVLLKIAFVRSCFGLKVKLSLCIVHYVRVISISW